MAANIFFPKTDAQISTNTDTDLCKSKVLTYSSPSASIDLSEVGCYVDIVEMNVSAILMNIYKRSASKINNLWNIIFVIYINIILYLYITTIQKIGVK